MNRVQCIFCEEEIHPDMLAWHFERCEERPGPAVALADVLVDVQDALATLPDMEDI